MRPITRTWVGATIAVALIVASPWGCGDSGVGPGMGDVGDVADTSDAFDAGTDADADAGEDDVSDTDGAGDADTTAPPDSGPGPDVEALWGAVTVPFEEDCTRCTPVLSHVLSHGADEVELLYDPEVEDPLTRWGDCLDAVFGCVREGGGDLPTCVTISPCPDPCKDAYVASVAGVAAREARFAHFDALFIDAGGACAIPAPPLQGGTP